jgi:UDP-glucose 4-epimerase
MRVLITGVAGFIGMHLALQLLQRGDEVVGIDNFNDYYDVTLKERRLQRVIDADVAGKFTFIRLDLADRAGMAQLFAEQGLDAVVNLAAQAGVRYSIDNPLAYIDSNLVGFGHILEGCRHNGVSIWCMRRPVRCMARMNLCRFRCMITWIIRCHCTLPPKKPMN